MKLGLGTVQFGVDYGVANHEGIVPRAEVAAMLALAARSGISLLDTAHLYGGSERVLGETMNTAGNFRIVSKTPRFDEAALTAEHADRLEEAAAKSLEQLRCQRLYGLLIHHTPDAVAVGSDRLFERLALLKERGWVEKIGVSVYRPSDLELVLDRHSIDLVQIPFNVFDRRLAEHDHLLSRLRRDKVEVHARSAFLQGLLLLPADQIDPYFDPWRSKVVSFTQRAEAAGLSRLEAALRFVLDTYFVDALIVGANSVVQLAEIVRSVGGVGPLPNFDDLAVGDEAFINPARWSLQRVGR